MQKLIIELLRLLRILAIPLPLKTASSLAGLLFRGVLDILYPPRARFRRAQSFHLAAVHYQPVHAKH
jgi:hypothetical protein